MWQEHKAFGVWTLYKYTLLVLLSTSVVLGYKRSWQQVLQHCLQELRTVTNHRMFWIFQDVDACVSDP